MATHRSAASKSAWSLLSNAVRPPPAATSASKKKSWSKPTVPAGLPRPKQNCGSCVRVDRVIDRGRVPQSSSLVSTTSRGQCRLQASSQLHEYLGTAAGSLPLATLATTRSRRCLFLARLSTAMLAASPKLAIEFSDPTGCHANAMNSVTTPLPKKIASQRRLPTAVLQPDQPTAGLRG